jgi:hypothetical protein
LRDSYVPWEAAVVGLSLIIVAFSGNPEIRWWYAAMAIGFAVGGLFRWREGRKRAARKSEEFNQWHPSGH